MKHLSRSRIGVVTVLSCVGGASAAVQPYDAGSGVLLYHFDEIVNDRVVNQGTAGVGMNILPGGGAALSPSIDGLDQAADLTAAPGALFRTAASDSLDQLTDLSTQTFTIEAWFNNPTQNFDGGRRDRTIFSLNTQGSRLTFIIQERTNLGDGEGMDNPYLARLIYIPTEGSIQQLSSTTFDLVRDTWHHIAVSYDNHGDDAAHDSTVTIYLDSEHNTTGQATVLASWTNQLDIRPFANFDEGMGAYSDVIFVGNDATGTRGLGGQMDEFRYANTVVGPGDFNLVPEPTSLALLGGGLAVFLRRKRSC